MSALPFRLGRAVERPPSALRGVERLVRDEPGVDRREVGVGLLEVADLLAGQRDLLREVAGVVGVTSIFSNASRAWLTRPSRASASTYVNEQVGSSLRKRRPSGDAAGRTGTPGRR
jgi:hypothetical protein